MADAGCRYVKFVIDRSLERKQRKHEIYGALNFVNPVLPVSPDAGTDIMDGGDVIRPEVSSIRRLKSGESMPIKTDGG